MNEEKQHSRASGLWVMQDLAVISTAHVPETYPEDLVGVPSVVFAPYENGAFVWFGEESKHYVDKRYHALIDWGYTRYAPDGFWLRLDCDGDTLDGLPVFDW